MDIVGLWSGVGLGVVAVALAVFFHRRSNRDPKPVYWVRAEQLVGESAGTDLDEIVITFAGERVPNVWRTKVGLYNAGRRELDGDAIAATDPLRIVLGPRTKVLGLRVVGATPHVNLRCEQRDETEIGVGFDFMNPKAAALVEVVHTGKPDPKVSGTIKGVGGAYRYKGPLATVPRLFPEAFPWWLSLALAPVPLVASVIVAAQVEADGVLIQDPVWGSLGAATLLGVSVGLLMEGWEAWRVSRCPKALIEFEAEGTI